MGVYKEADVLEYIQELGVYRNTYRGMVTLSDFLNTVQKAKEESLLYWGIITP